MWPFKKKIPFNSWPIVRTKPNGKKYGRAIQLFINNMQCHLTTINVFSDGAVDCWGFVDLNLFRQKLRLRWVVPGPAKADQCISVFHFGMTGCRNAEWLQNSDSIISEVESIVSALNPERKDLVDMQGSDVETRGKIRYAKMGLPDKKPYRIAESGEELFGSSFSILRVLPNAFELTNLFLFSDGLVKVGWESELSPLDKLKELYGRKEIANSAPAGSRINLPGLGSFEATSDFGGLSENDRINELYDELNKMQGKPSVVTLCARAYKEYEQSPSNDKKELLRQAYERVPKHLRCYCGDMDTRDTAIRTVLYGENHWEVE